MAAVQTLSRLNRTCDGKDGMFVLDFRNDAEDIRASFAPWYTSTVAPPTDPNLLYDTRHVLAAPPERPVLCTTAILRPKPPHEYRTAEQARPQLRGRAQSMSRLAVSGQFLIADYALVGVGEFAAGEGRRTASSVSCQAAGSAGFGRTRAGCLGMMNQWAGGY